MRKVGQSSINQKADREPDGTGGINATTLRKVVVKTKGLYRSSRRRRKLGTGTGKSTIRGP